MVDYIVVGISIVIFFFYLTIILMSIEIKRRLEKDAGRAFIYLILAILFLIIRRIQQIFLETEILNTIPYLSDIITFIFAVLLFMTVFSLYKSIKKASGSRKNAGYNLNEYKRKFGRKIIR